jgi:hypothetical protein
MLLPYAGTSKVRRLKVFMEAGHLNESVPEAPARSSRGPKLQVPSHGVFRALIESPGFELLRLIARRVATSPGLAISDDPTNRGSPGRGVGVGV